MRVEYLKDGTPIEDTIHNCTDIRKFVSVRRVTGGATLEGEFIGKVVRWYYGTRSPGPIVYASNGNTVSLSYGARPCMTLPDEFPDDVDYAWYISKAQAMLKDVGFYTLT